MNSKKFVWSKGDIEFLDDVQEGSASSGNYGHAGRPGEVGGSAPGGGGGTVDAGGARVGGDERSLKIVSDLKKKFETDRIAIQSVKWKKNPFRSDKMDLQITYPPTTEHESIRKRVQSLFPDARRVEMGDKNYPGQGKSQFFGKEFYQFSVFDLGRSIEEGSASSGNYGHAGRPGEVGGSAPGGGGGSSSGKQHGGTHTIDAAGVPMATVSIQNLSKAPEAEVAANIAKLQDEIGQLPEQDIKDLKVFYHDDEDFARLLGQLSLFQMNGKKALGFFYSNPGSKLYGFHAKSTSSNYGRVARHEIGHAVWQKFDDETKGAWLQYWQDCKAGRVDDSLQGYAKDVKNEKEFMATMYAEYHSGNGEIVGSTGVMELMSRWYGDKTPQLDKSFYVPKVTYRDPVTGMTDIETDKAWAKERRVKKQERDAAQRVARSAEDAKWAKVVARAAARRAAKKR